MWICIVLSAVALMLIVWRYDLYQREPLVLVALAGLFGAGTAWVAGFVEDALIIPHEAMHSTTAQALIAAGTEELLKLAAVVLLAVLFRWHFDDPMDGLIYGAATGLGMGVAESAMYLSVTPDESPLTLGPEFIRLILHLLFGSLTGFGVGLAWCRIPRWPLIGAASLGTALAMHATWDRICGIPGLRPGSELYQRSVAVGIMVLGTVAFGASVGLGTRWSRVYLRVRKAHVLWGWPFVRQSTPKVPAAPHADSKVHDIIQSRDVS